mmetsp:Transcript_7271/g.17615  ORF Transcript_7271/g.17615 Transcript_7271/m.17615 type:complete len:275 (-) Transcript_7271:578-1402(-)
MFGGSLFGDDPFFADPFGERPQAQGRDRRTSRNGGNDQVARPRDPFAAMEQRMSQMMGGGMLGGFGFGGGDPFGGMSSSSMQMMSSSSDGSAGGPGFRSSSSTMVFSSKMGPDGQMHTERYSSSAVRAGQKNAFEQQQAYSNSSTGVDKMSMERQHGSRGRKMVKEYSHASGEDRQTEYLRGIEDHQKQQFDDHWRSHIAPNMPKHMGGMGGGGGGGMGPRGITGGMSSGGASLGYNGNARSSRRSSGSGNDGGRRALGYCGRRAHDLTQKMWS